MNKWDTISIKTEPVGWLAKLLWKRFKFKMSVRYIFVGEDVSTRFVHVGEGDVKEVASVTMHAGDSLNLRYGGGVKEERA